MENNIDALKWRIIFSVLLLIVSFLLFLFLALKDDSKKVKKQRKLRATALQGEIEKINIDIAILEK